MVYDWVDIFQSKMKFSGTFWCNVSSKSLEGEIFKLFFGDYLSVWSDPLNDIE